MQMHAYIMKYIFIQMHEKVEDEIPHVPSCKHSPKTRQSYKDYNKNRTNYYRANINCH